VLKNIDVKNSVLFDESTEQQRKRRFREQQGEEQRPREYRGLIGEMRQYSAI
jgi:hypothetical protein